LEVASSLKFPGVALAQKEDYMMQHCKWFGTTRRQVTSSAAVLALVFCSCCCSFAVSTNTAAKSPADLAVGCNKAVNCSAGQQAIGDNCVDCPSTTFKADNASAACCQFCLAPAVTNTNSGATTCSEGKLLHYLTCVIDCTYGGQCSLLRSAY